MALFHSHTLNHVMNIIIILCISACVAKLADVVFVVDSSGSIGMENFAKIKAFVKQTLNFFDIGTDLTRVGLITFNQYGSLQFGLGKYNTSNALVTAVQSIIYSQGGTNTGMIELFTLCKGGNFNIHIWAWFDYFI